MEAEAYFSGQPPGCPDHSKSWARPAFPLAALDGESLGLGFRQTRSHVFESSQNGRANRRANGHIANRNNHLQLRALSKSGECQGDKSRRANGAAMDAKKKKERKKYIYMRSARESF